MQDERRLVGRVLRHWTEMVHGRGFPRLNEIDPWMLGEDWANCLLMAVQSPVELSHFITVGENLAVALCPKDTLAGVLLSHLPQVLSARRCVMERQTMRSLIEEIPRPTSDAIWCPTFSQGSKASTCRQLSWGRN